MSIIDAIDSFYANSKRATCSGEKNCILKLDGLNKYTILKGESTCEVQEEMCDFLVFIDETNEELLIAIIEFKSNNLRVDKVVSQIESGLKKALLMLKECSIICKDDELKCLRKKKMFLIAVAPKWESVTLRMMKSRKITVEGNPHHIYTKGCGDLLKDVLS